MCIRHSYLHQQSLQNVALLTVQQENETLRTPYEAVQKENEAVQKAYEAVQEQKETLDLSQPLGILCTQRICK
jgi:GTP cyclohydrolase III